jgi:peptidoglycan/xylan/chitin deacetylase (PgdA/CDA1 family)
MLNSAHNLRLDRILSVAIAEPLHRWIGGEARRIPILMYHSIDGTRRAGHPYFETRTSPERFALQMQFLAEAGYRALTLSQAVHDLQSGDVHPRSVVITFDDAYLNFYHAALPVLGAYHFPATVFAVAGFVGSSKPGWASFMSWQHLRGARSAGIEIGSHTVNHPELHRLSFDQVGKEIRESKDLIEQNLGSRIQTFSYPYAFPEQDHSFVSLLKSHLLDSGYVGGVSTILGTAALKHELMFLPRIPVNSLDDLQFFQAKLRGGYNWLHGVQYASKWVRNRL